MALKVSLQTQREARGESTWASGLIPLLKSFTYFNLNSVPYLRSSQGTSWIACCRCAQDEQGAPRPGHQVQDPHR